MDLVESIVDEIRKNYKFGESITIYFNSRGGYVESGEALADIIMYLKSMGSTITAINIGDIMSATTIPWLVCDVRLWDERYNFLIHNPYVEKVTGDATELLEQAIQLTVMEDDIAELYSVVSGESKEFMLELMKQERPLTTEEILQYNFATNLLGKELKN